MRSDWFRSRRSLVIRLRFDHERPPIDCSMLSKHGEYRGAPPHSGLVHVAVTSTARVTPSPEICPRGPAKSPWGKSGLCAHLAEGWSSRTLYPGSSGASHFSGRLTTRPGDA